MTAPELLDGIRARGGVATVKHASGATVLNVSPRSLALEFLPELKRFKPALLALLDGDAKSTSAQLDGLTPSPMPEKSPESGLTPSLDAIGCQSAQNSARGPQRRFVAVCDAHARRQVRPELARLMPERDVLELGRLLIKLDNGEDIE